MKAIPMQTYIKATKSLRLIRPLVWLLISSPALFAQAASVNGLAPDQATKLAELMCRQIPNVTSIIESMQITAIDSPPSADPFVSDDVYDTLVRLGPYAVPCLVDRLASSRWMPDPRSEPLLGTPLVGDVAYMILADKGVPDFIPKLSHKKAADLRMDFYFTWPSVGDHRQRLQKAVREWVDAHPHFCRASRIVHKTALSRPKFQMTTGELEAAHARFSLLRPGMKVADVLRIAGTPDATDLLDQHTNQPSENREKPLWLLGICSSARDESRASIYFTERWTEDISRRDPFRDRYVILFFSSEGKFTRMFSNIAEIPPIVPSTSLWQRLIWEQPAKKK